MSAIKDPVSPLPFVEWFLREEAKLRGDGNDSPRVAMLSKCGWARDSGARRLYRWEHESRHVERADVEDALTVAGAFWWDVYPDESPKARADRGRVYYMDDDLLVRAHTRHMEGESIRSIARDIWPQTTYASVKTLVNTLSTAFRHREWETRDRCEATAQSNRERAWRPFCEHVHKAGRRKGQRCARRANGNDRWCWHHHPDRIAEGIARVRQSDRKEVA